MEILDKKCIVCGQCVTYCPVSAIKAEQESVKINQDDCLECGTCGRTNIVNCPTNAIIETQNTSLFPRSLRKHFSDPSAYHYETKVPGRGTEEVKTNDVTGRVTPSEVGIAIEMGRPCIGASFRDIETVTSALAQIGVSFEKCNPLIHLMNNPDRGLFPESVKKQKVVSAIIEFTIPLYQLDDVIFLINKKSKEISTVFSLGLISCFDKNNKLIAAPYLKKLGVSFRENAKINLGLGKPLYKHKNQQDDTLTA